MYLFFLNLKFLLNEIFTPVWIKDKSTFFFYADPCFIH